MRILITTDFYLPHITGVTNVVVNEQRMLALLGHDIRVLTISRSTTSSYKDGIYAMKGSAIQPLRDSQMTFCYKDPLLDDIRCYKPDIIHSNNEFFTMGYARRLANELDIPLIHTCHTDFTRYDVQQRIRHTLYDSLIAQIVKRRIRYCDLLVSPSVSHKQMLERYNVKQPIVVLPSGIDLDRFQASLAVEERRSIRCSLGFDDTSFVLLSVCRLASEKRVDQTIDAFFLLSFLEPSARLLVVGGGPKEESLRKQVRDLGLESLVVFNGAVPASDVHTYYQVADLFVSSSVRESQGLGFVEAMAASLPLLLQEDHSLGLSVEELGIGKLYEDAHSFVTAVSSLIEDPLKAKEMGVRAKEASNQFSLPAWSERLSALLEKAAFDFRNKEHD